LDASDSEDNLLEHLGEEVHTYRGILLPYLFSFQSLQLVARDLTSETSEAMHASNSESLPLRILDDPFHFMDRLLRLLSKKHSAFKCFSHDFSQAIFIRDKHDVSRVKAILDAKGISWDFAIRAKAFILNKRIRRYIPPRDILYKQLQTLFTSYQDIICSTQGRRFTFFDKEARQMAARLLETVRLGLLSDPYGIPLYYLMGTDKDGLPLYRTIRGTNSVEGGVHMAIRRVFGSLQASPELAECILLNWIHRRNLAVRSIFLVWN
jgi:hypothetical protein